MEKSISEGEVSDLGANAVLVSVSRVEKLRVAYLNYYLDAGAFLALFDRLILNAPSSSSGSAIDRAVTKLKRTRIAGGSHSPVGQQQALGTSALT
ncbi:MAG: hypothetical protein WB789_10360 [Thermoplasmata archaeon]